jgi:hypothetical protein
MIPFEFGDPGDPPRAQRKNGKDAKRRHHGRTNASRHIRRRAPRVWRGHPVELLNFPSAIGRHDSWKVEWVREEGEDMIEGKGNPLLELQSFGRHTRFSESDTETLQNSPNFACSETAFGYFHNKIRASRGEQEKS